MVDPTENNTLGGKDGPNNNFGISIKFILTIVLISMVILAPFLLSVLF